MRTAIIITAALLSGCMATTPQSQADMNNALMLLQMARPQRPAVQPMPWPTRCTHSRVGNTIQTVCQ